MAYRIRFYDEGGNGDGGRIGGEVNEATKADCTAWLRREGFTFDHEYGAWTARGGDTVASITRIEDAR